MPLSPFGGIGVVGMVGVSGVLLSPFVSSVPSVIRLCRPFIVEKKQSPPPALQEEAIFRLAETLRRT